MQALTPQLQPKTNKGTYQEATNLPTFLFEFLLSCRPSVEFPPPFLHPFFSLSFSYATLLVNMTSGRVAGRALNVVIVQHIICHVLSVCGRGGVAVCRVKCEEELDQTATTPVLWKENLSRGEERKMTRKRKTAKQK